VSALNWQHRREEWAERVKSLGPRAVYNVAHRTPDIQAQFTEMQKQALLPELRRRLTGDELVTLDFGCGIGRWSPVLADLIGGQVIATDPTPALLAEATRTRAHPAVTYVPYEDGVIKVAYGLVHVLWSCLVLSTILDDEMLKHTVSEFRRVLVPNGLLFVVDNTSGPAHRPVVRSRWSRSRTVEEYTRAFEPICLVEAIETYTDQGEGHHIFVGRKTS